MSTTPNLPPPVPEAPPSTVAATPVMNTRTVATGAIPKQMQSWIFLGIIAVVAVGLWFSGMGKKPKNTTGTGSTTVAAAKPMVGGLTPDEIQKRLEESEATRRTEVGNLRPPGPIQLSDAQLLPGLGTSSPNPTVTTAASVVVDPLAEEERKREYAARFASNIALSYRADAHAGDSAPGAPSRVSTNAVNANAVSETAALSASFQQQLESLQAQQQQRVSAPAQLALPQPQQQQTASGPAHTSADLNAATGKNHAIFEGTVLESVLVNRLNGDFAGPVVCQTTNDIYSHNYDELLIPAGSRLLGETKKVSDVGQDRLAVVFHRLIMPDGYAVELDQAPGLNQIGETAIHDKVNNHYFKIFGSSIAVGAIAGLASIGTNNSAVTGLPASNSSAYREGVTGSLSQSSLHILDRFLNIPPTITIREGHRVRVFLTQDLLVPAYARHKMPSDL